MIRLLFRLLPVVAFGVLTACASAPLDETPDPIGDFKLGFFVPSTAADLTKGPVSREATPEEWKAALKTAFEPRFKRYTGDSFYHIGAIVDGYVLAQPGVPVVMSPKSVLILRITVIEDATGTQYPLEEPHQLTVLENVNAESIVGSGLTKTKEQQLADLAENAAKATERWLREQEWLTSRAPVLVEPEDAGENEGEAEGQEAIALSDGAELEAVLSPAADDEVAAEVTPEAEE